MGHVPEVARVLRCVGFRNPTPKAGLGVHAVLEVQSELDAAGLADLPNLRGWLRRRRIRDPGFHPAGFAIGIPKKYDISYKAFLISDNFNIPEPMAVGKLSDPAARSGQQPHSSGSSAAHSTGRIVHHPWCHVECSQVTTLQMVDATRY
jgi:hypothetical protein